MSEAIAPKIPARLWMLWDRDAELWEEAFTGEPSYLVFFSEDEAERYAARERRLTGIDIVVIEVKTASATTDTPDSSSPPLSIEVAAGFAGEEVDCG